MSRRTIVSIASVLCLLAPAASRAAAYDALYVFGDSLSDRGNLADVLATSNPSLPVNFPDPPSNHDSFTNGPVAVSLLANRYGVAADPSLWVSGFADVHNQFGGASFKPGTNYAVAGATAAAQAAGGPPAINLPQQVAAYLAFSGGKADSSALYTVFIGGNDVRNAALQGTGAAALAAGVQAEIAAIVALEVAGARNFLIPNVPDVGDIPEFRQDNAALATTATNDSILYDQLLAAGVAGLVSPLGTTITQFDLFTFNSEIKANAANLGFTNTSDRCYTATPYTADTSPQCGASAQNINQFLYWDSIHPTGRVQALWAERFAEELAGNPDPSPVPEPASLALLAIAATGLGVLRRRAAQRA